MPHPPAVSARSSAALPRPSVAPTSVFRRVAAVITLAVLLALSACGTTTDGTDPTDEPTSSPAATTPSPTEDGGDEETPSPTEGDDGDATGDEVTVTLQGFAFRSPEGGTSLTIAAGTTVNFVNDDAAPHTATHGTDGNSADGAEFDINLPTGESGSFTFDEPGTYPVTCRIHPAMNMTITVE